MRPGGCGNDPRAHLTDGDRAAVARFQDYLVAAATPAAERTEEQAALVAEYETPPPPR